MGYALTLGRVHVLAGMEGEVRHACSCDEARAGCRPAFVFSVPGQVRFRTALHHLTGCRKQSCRHLKSRVFAGMVDKLGWLLEEESLLGCVHIQPALYGAKSVSMRRRDFPAISRHLARCPKESCAQLRRALLLSVREEVRL